MKRTYLGILLIIFAGFSSCLEVESPFPEENIIEIMSTQNELSLYLEALDLTGLREVFESYFVYTIFAPSNNALQQFVFDQGYTELSEVPKDDLERLLLYHVIPGRVPVEQIGKGYFLTLGISPIDSAASVVAFFNTTTSGVIINQEARIELGNLEASNGVIHRISNVLSFPHILDVIETDENFSILFDAIVKAGMQSTFIAADPVTLFAPVDNAFELFFAQDPGIDNLDDITVPRLQNILKTHVINGNVRANEINAGEFPTLNPEVELSIFASPDGELTINNGITTALTNIQANNGMIHAVTALIPD